MIVIDQTQNNGSVELAVGDSLRVQLSENPTTGYRWQLQSAGAPALRMTEDSFEAPTGKPGGGGVRHWTFVADQPAAAALRMELKRSWQPQSVDSFSATVNVKAKVR